MRFRTTFRRGVFALVIIFGLGSLHAAACPILCATQHCTEHNEKSTILGIPRYHACCCPGNSNGTNRTLCSTSANGCMTHAQFTALLNSNGIGMLETCSLEILTPRSVPLVNSSLSIITYASLSPPGFSSGKAICRKASLLRV